MRIWTESLENRWMNDCDALFIAGGQGAQHARHDSVLRKRLGRVAPKIPFVKAIGEGSQILAAANLTLQNRSLDFAEEPATASALANSLFIAEQTLTLDDPKGPIAAALSIIKRDYGAAIAREVSERSIPGAWQKLSTVLDDTDSGGVRQKYDAAARWIRENYVRPISIADAARVAAMSERNFLRRFKAQIGLTPSEYLLRARLDASCMLLAATDLPVDKIARRCGAGKAATGSRRSSGSACRFRRPSIGSRGGARWTRSEGRGRDSRRHPEVLGPGWCLDCLMALRLPSNLRGARFYPHRKTSSMEP